MGVPEVKDSLNTKVAGITANTEQNIAPLVPLSGPSPLQLSNEPHMSIVASENAGLVPRELALSVDPWITETLPPNNTTNSSTLASTAQLSQQQSKIMNVVVPNVACTPAATKKIRRKPENKPQSQINKCNNEKRRRELENEYIEQLGEFLHLNKRDMTACKPDKAAILSEVVKKFRNLLEQRARENSSQARNCNKCPAGCSDSCTLHPVQQGEVSSTEPPLPEPSINGHSPEKSAYFEAVQHYISNVGWALLEINSEGYIECATENVKEVLQYSRQELCGQSIYSYLHTGDHNKISPILDKNTLSFDWDQDEGTHTFAQTPKRTVRIRWLLKSPEDTLEQRQQRSNRYKDLLIISAPVKDDTDESSSVLCLITLPEDDQSMDTTMPPSKEELTIRIDSEGKIIKVDTTLLRQQFATFLTKEIGHGITQLVHPQDRQRLLIHLKEVIQGQTDAQITNYRLLLSPDRYVHTKVQSRMFKSDVTGEPDFVMLVHEILSENEIMSIDGASFSGMIPNVNHPMSSQNMLMKQHSQGGMGIGGPLIGSHHINGGSLSQISPRNALLNDNPLIPPSSLNEYYPPEFDFDFTSPPFDIENQLIDSRPESRASMGSVSTPRPSSATAGFSPSPLTPYSQPSPASITNNNNTTMTNNNLTMTNNNAASASNNTPSGFNSAGSNHSGTFQFNFDDKEKVQEQLQKIQQQQQENNTSERLRNLLMKSPSALEDEQQRKNQILKNLLNNDDDKDGSLTHKMNPLSAANRNPIQRPRSVTSGVKNDNNMLLQLLNDKSDDDDSNSKQHSELLKCLQNPTKDQKELNNNADLDNEQLKQRLRFQGSLGEGNNRKRPSDESDDANLGAPKNRLSKLQQRNQMLAQLLAGPSRPINTTSISSLQGIAVVRPMPDIAHAKQLEQQQQQASATPNQNIPNNNNKTMNNNNNPVTKNNNLKTSHQKIRQQNLNRAQSMPGGKNLKQMGENAFLTQMQNHQQQMIMNRTVNVLTSSANSQSPFDGSDGSQFVTSSPAITLAPASSSSTIQSDSVIDPELNDILDNLFDDGSYNEDPTLNFLQNVHNINNTQLKQQEELAQINKIQQSLMECEDEANFSGSPPAYPLAAMTSQSRIQQGSYTQPPPGYNQQRNSIRLPQMSVTSNNNNNNTNNNNNIVTNSNTTAVAQTTNIQKTINPSVIERYRLQQQQQLEQKHRLLQQQQNQQIVVTAGADQMCLPNTGVQSIDSLLNNTVAPNVTLTSRGKMVPDPQLSPNFPQSLMHQQLSPNQQRTQNIVSFSSQANQTFQQSSFNTNGGQRLSPQQQQQQQINQQLINTFQAGNASNATNSSQLSPRQPPFNLQPNTQVQASQANWNQQQQQSNNIRLSLQQSNPMLNAQLSQQSVNTFTNQRQMIAQRQRSLNSPGTPVRQNSFSSTDFPEPPSPSAQQQYSNTIFNQQQMRLQRQQSVPQATQHLPGSPRPFGPGLTDGPSGFSHSHNMMYSPGGGTDFYRVNQTGGQNNGLNSQMVRQGLRAVVSGRQTVGNGSAGNNGIRRNMSSPMDALVGGSNGNGNIVDTNSNPNNPNNNLMINQQQQQTQQQQLPNSMINSDMDPALRFGFEMPQGTTNVETKLTAPPSQCWSGGNSNNSRISLEERTGDPKSSLLLQKLLSD